MLIDILPSIALSIGPDVTLRYLSATGGRNSNAGNAPLAAPGSRVGAAVSSSTYIWFTRRHRRNISIYPFQLFIHSSSSGGPSMFHRDSSVKLAMTICIYISMAMSPCGSRYLLTSVTVAEHRARNLTFRDDRQYFTTTITPAFRV